MIRVQGSFEKIKNRKKLSKITIDFNLSNTIELLIAIGILLVFSTKLSKLCGPVDIGVDFEPVLIRQFMICT